MSCMRSRSAIARGAGRRAWSSDRRQAEVPYNQSKLRSPVAIAESDPASGSPSGARPRRVAAEAPARLNRALTRPRGDHRLYLCDDGLGAAGAAPAVAAAPGSGAIGRHAERDSWRRPPASADRARGSRGRAAPSCRRGSRRGAPAFLAWASLREREDGVVVRDLLAVDDGVAVRVQLERRTPSARPGPSAAFGRSSGSACETMIFAVTMKMMRSTSVMSTSGVTLMPAIMPSSSFAARGGHQRLLLGAASAACRLRRP